MNKEKKEEAKKEDTKAKPLDFDMRLKKIERVETEVMNRTSKALIKKTMYAYKFQDADGVNEVTLKTEIPLQGVNASETVLNISFSNSQMTIKDFVDE
jgi:hypothetical protein